MPPIYVHFKAKLFRQENMTAVKNCHLKFDREQCAMVGWDLTTPCLTRNQGHSSLCILVLQGSAAQWVHIVVSFPIKIKFLSFKLNATLL